MRLLLRLYTSSSFLDGGAERFLGPFEASAGYAPTHWGRDELDVVEYSREALQASLDGERGHTTAFVFRRANPKYSGYLAEYPGSLSVFFLECSGRPSLARTRELFDLGSTIAETVAPELGLIHLAPAKEGRRMARQRVEAYTRATMPSPDQLQGLGPVAVFARNWFGSELAGRFGPLLEKVGGSQRPSAGGIALDLCSEPWSADLAQLVAAQDQAMGVLRPSGLFGDYARFPDFQPGPKWTPLTLK